MLRHRDGILTACDACRAVSAAAVAGIARCTGSIVQDLTLTTVAQNSMRLAHDVPGSPLTSLIMQIQVQAAERHHDGSRHKRKSRPPA